MTNPTKYSLLQLVLIVLFPSLVCSQSLTKEIQFKNINTANGLPHNNVNAIVKDDFGFLWIGTNNGLCRYESSERIKLFQRKEDDPAGLQSSEIRALLKDSKGNLWIGTRLGGVSKMDLKTEEIITYRHDPNDQNTLNDDEILCITEDRKGRIWIGTEKGLSLYNHTLDNFSSSFGDANKPFAFRGKAVLNITEDDNGWIWLGTWDGGLNLLLTPEVSSLNLAKFRHIEINNNPKSRHTWKVLQDKEKRYWIGTMGAGLFYMQLPTNATLDLDHQQWIPSFVNFKNQSNNYNSLSNNNIFDINLDSKGHLWIGTGYGLNHIKKEELKKLSLLNKSIDKKLELTFNRNNYDPTNSASIASNVINYIYEDDQDLIWIGNFSGISLYNWFTNQFDIFNLSNTTDNLMDIRGIQVTNEYTVWMATINDGILHYDLKKQILLNTDILSTKLWEVSYSAIYKSDEGVIYVGCGNGVATINPKNSQVKTFPFSKSLGNSHSPFNAFVTHITKDKKGSVWIATQEGLLKLNEKTGDYQHFNKTEGKGTLSDLSLTSVLEDSKGNIWITSYNGLNRIIESDGEIRFENFKTEADNPHSIPSNRTISLLEHDDILYIGTTNGLCGYNYKTQQFENYSIEDNKYLFTALKSNETGIWASTTSGLVHFNPKTKQFNTFEELDGLGNLTFQPNSNSQDEQGYLYFASSKSITKLHPSKIIRNTIAPPTYVTNVKILGPDGLEEKNVMTQKELNLNHNDYHLTIDFTTFNFNRPEKNQLAYMLEGFDQEWIYKNNKNNTAIYTNLAPGLYTFKVKAANNDGVWTSEPATLKIKVNPAFWQTFWFRALLLLSIFLFIVLGFRIYTRRVRKNNLVLQNHNSELNKEIKERKRVEKALQEREQFMEELVKVRTKELEEKNEEVNNLLDKIKIRNDELETIVEERTIELRKNNQELSRSNKDLEQFAYIASHDLQEPLRIVGNFVGLLKRKYVSKLDETAEEYIGFAVDGVSRMSQLIKSILTYSKVGRSEIEFQEVNLNNTIEVKLYDLSQKIKERNVLVQMDKLPNIKCQKDQIGMVFYNLVNNAIKFNKSPQPIIKIQTHENEEEGFWKFSVHDNGIGIKPEFQEKIFEIFRRLHKAEYEGTGIGLALCQKIVDRHEGRIWIESTFGESTTFFFTIKKNLQNQSNPKTIASKTVAIQNNN